jgi:hypothetical protein
MAALAGCAGLFEDEDIRDSDGDGVIDSEDYAPRDPDVQEKSDLVSTTDQTTDPADTPVTGDPTETEEPEVGTTVTPTPGMTPTDAGPTHTPERTVPPSTGTGALTSDPAQILSFDPDPVPVAAGETNPLVGELVNPYLFRVEDIQATLDAPEGWSVAAVSATSFDELESQASQTAEWELTVPESASGRYLLLANVTYATGASGGGEADVWQGVTISA